MCMILSSISRGKMTCINAVPMQISGIIVGICESNIDRKRLGIPRTKPNQFAMRNQLDPSLLRDGLFSRIRIPSSPPLILTLILPSRSSSCITIFTQVL